MYNINSGYKDYSMSNKAHDTYSADKKHLLQVYWRGDL